MPDFHLVHTGRQSIDTIKTLLIAHGKILSEGEAHSTKPKFVLPRDPEAFVQQLKEKASTEEFQAIRGLIAKE